MTKLKYELFSFLTVVALTMASILTVPSVRASQASSAVSGDAEVARNVPGDISALSMTTADKAQEEKKAQGQPKVVICHATGSSKNPYVRIEVGNPASLEGHDRHPNDIINPAGGVCPGQMQPEQGIIKICKIAGTGVTANTLFTFTVGGRTIVVAAGTCNFVSFNLGSRQTIQETLNGYRVTAIAVNPANREVSRNLDAGNVTINVGGGVTTVTFTNERRMGFLEICKEGTANGTFTFTVNGQTVTINVQAGATRPVCAPAIELPAGQVTVTEGAAPGTTLAGIRTVPENRLVSSNLGNRTATVNIVAGGRENQTIVIFRNDVNNNLKICKQLAQGTTAPAGTLFTFTVDGQTVSVAPGTCVFVTVAGGNRTVTETGPAGYQVVDITSDPANRLVSRDLAARSAVINVGDGVTTVTFTNRAGMGFLEICKEGTANGTFTFTVSGQTVTVNVQAGATRPVCAPAIQVSAGQVTVTEGAAPGTTLAGIRTVPENRLVSSNLGNRTATVNIVEGARENQTIVIFRNNQS